MRELEEASWWGRGKLKTRMSQERRRLKREVHNILSHKKQASLGSPKQALNLVWTVPSASAEIETASLVGNTYIERLTSDE